MSTFKMIRITQMILGSGDKGEAVNLEGLEIKAICHEPTGVCTIIHDALFGRSKTIFPNQYEEVICPEEDFGTATV